MYRLSGPSSFPFPSALRFRSPLCLEWWYGLFIRRAARKFIRHYRNMNDNTALPAPMSPRKEAIRTLHDELAPERMRWLERGAFFHEEDQRYLKFLIPENLRILELGCGNGQLLAALNPSFGVGVDFSGGMLAEARRSYPNLSFIEGDVEEEDVIKSLPGPFDIVLIADTLGSLDDCQRVFETLHQHCTRDTRLIVVYFSHLWQPAIRLGEILKVRMPQPAQNALSPADIRSLAALSDFDTVKSEVRMLSPFRLFGLGRLLNRFVAPFPLIRQACLRHYSVGRSLRRVDDGLKSATVVVTGAKRTRQHRGGGAAHSAICRTTGNHIRRGTF